MWNRSCFYKNIKLFRVRNIYLEIFMNIMYSNIIYIKKMVYLINVLSFFVLLKVN